MNELQLLLDEYLAARRALGAKLKLSGRLLQRFVAFVAQRKGAFITTELALQWATEPRGAQPAQWANRLAMVRRFAQYASIVEPRHEVPPPDLLPYRYHRPPPYIYRDEEVAALIGAAQRLPGFTGLRPHTCATLLGLVAVTGMRVNEPLGLDRDDVRLAQAFCDLRCGDDGAGGSVAHPAAVEEAQGMGDDGGRHDLLFSDRLAQVGLGVEHPVGVAFGRDMGHGPLQVLVLDAVFGRVG